MIKELFNKFFSTKESLYIDKMPNVVESKKKRQKLSEQARLTISNYKATKFKDRMKIDEWQQAITVAEQPPYFHRIPLYEIYKWSMDDGQIISGTTTRKNKVLSEPFALIDQNGNENKELTDTLKSLAFYEFMENALDTKFWGHTLLEVEVNEKGLIAIELIDRLFVSPDRGLFLINPLISSSNGIPYRELLDDLNLIEIGKPRDLGLLRKAARYAIWKNYSFSDWSRHAEKYGMPKIITHTSSTDEVELDELAKDLADLGSNGWAILAENDKVTLLQEQSTNPHEIYKSFIDSNDAQISKILNGQTMTADNGSSRSQAEVHERVLDSYVEADMRWLSFIINKDLFPFLLRKGYTKIEGYKFIWKHLQQDDEDKNSPKDNAKKEPPKSENENLTETPPVGGRGGYSQTGEGALSFFDSALLINTNAKIAKTHIKLAGLYQETWQNLTETPPVGGGGASVPFSEGWETIWQKLATELYQNEQVDTTPLLLQTAKTLQQALLAGGVSYETLPALAAFMQENIFMFSGFKTYQQLQQASLLLRDASGKLRSFSDFRKEIKKLDSTYNGAYLNAEYNLAVSSSQMAVKWKKFDSQKDDYDLVYDAVNDKRTRPEHAAIDGVVEPVDSSFWDTHYPPNGWNCRCTVYQVDRGTKGTTMPKEIPSNPSLFQNNVGKTGVIFPSSHPYFDVQKAEKDALYKVLREQMPYSAKDVQTFFADKQVKQSLENVINKELHKEFSNLEVPQTTATHHYTRMIRAYAPLNKQLINNELTVFNEAFANLLDSALNRLPNYTNDVYRGSILSDEVIAFYRQAYNSENKIVTHKFFTSSSSEFMIAEEFTKFRKLKSNEKPVIIIIKSKTGKVIEKLSEAGELFENDKKKHQKEVLFKRNTKFEVVYFDDTKDVIDIVLTEI